MFSLAIIILLYLDAMHLSRIRIWAPGTRREQSARSLPAADTSRCPIRCGAGP